LICDLIIIIAIGLRLIAYVLLASFQIHWLVANQFLTFSNLL